MMDKYAFRNITISGLPGCGSTTLLNLLRDSLKFDKWTGYSGGDFMRAYAEEKGLFTEEGGLHHDASHYEDGFDRKIDMGVHEKLQTERRWIIEAWLAGFLAQGVDGVLKVLVICSDESVRVDRVVNRDSVTVDIAKENLFSRYDNNLKKWARMYKNEWDEWLVKTGKVKSSDPINFWREDLYDLVIDTYSNNQEQTLLLVLDAIKKKI